MAARNAWGPAAIARRRPRCPVPGRRRLHPERRGPRAAEATRREQEALRYWWVGAWRSSWDVGRFEGAIAIPILLAGDRWIDSPFRPPAASLQEALVAKNANDHRSFGRDPADIVGKLLGQVSLERPLRYRSRRAGSTSTSAPATRELPEVNTCATLLVPGGAHRRFELIYFTPFAMVLLLGRDHRGRRGFAGAASAFRPRVAPHTPIGAKTPDAFHVSEE
jgi:hypothetical protein